MNVHINILCSNPICFICLFKVILYGDVEHLEKGENVIYLSNHQSTMDWVVADMMAIRAGCLGSMRYVLKDGLKYMPLYGFSFGVVSKLFIHIINIQITSIF